MIRLEYGKWIFWVHKTQNANFWRFLKIHFLKNIHFRNNSGVFKSKNLESSRWSDFKVKWRFWNHKNQKSPFWKIQISTFCTTSIARVILELSETDFFRKNGDSFGTKISKADFKKTPRQLFGKISIFEPKIWIISSNPIRKSGYFWCQKC